MALPSSFFASTEVHKKEVELADGEKHTLWFKELPHIEIRKFQLAEASDDQDVKASSIAKMIAASLCEEDGRAAMTVDQALTLKASVASKLLVAITEVNAATQKKG
jgi:hypothetical protein